MKTHLYIFLLLTIIISSNNFVLAQNLSSLLTPKNPADMLMSTSVNYTLKSTVSSDTVNYAQLSLCTDSTCTSCGAPYQTITAASQTSPISITSSGVSYSINTTAITSYLKDVAQITSNNTYYVGLYVQSAVQNCSSSYCGTSVDTNGSQLCMSASYNGSSVTSLSSNDNGIATLQSSTTQRVYIVDSGNQAVYYCTINGTNPSTGTLSCTATSATGVTSPWSISFATVAGTQRAYVVGSGDPSNNIYSCSIHNTGSIGDLYSCSTVGANLFAGGGGNPFQIAFATFNVSGTQTQYAYVASGANVYKCTLNSSNGSFTSCSALTTGISASDIEGVATAMISTGTQYVYLTDQNSGTYQCSLSSSGDFTSCSKTADGQANTNGIMQAISVSMVNGAQYAYLGDFNSRAYYCLLSDSTGSLSSCAAEPSSQPSWGPTGIHTIIANGGKQYVYIASQGFSNGIYSAPISSDGTLASDSTTATGTTWSTANAISSAYIRLP